VYANGSGIARQSKHSGFSQYDDHFDRSCNASIHSPSRV
jgi:hypothetical protein